MSLKDELKRWKEQTYAPMVKRYPDSWNLNFFARIACDAGDGATAKRILALVGDRIDADAWANRGSYIRCKNMAAS